MTEPTIGVRFTPEEVALMVHTITGAMLPLMRDMDARADTLAMCVARLQMAREDTHGDDATFWATVADGVSHDPRCCRYFTGGNGTGWVCLRCQVEDVSARLTTQREGLAARITELETALHEARAECANWMGKESEARDEAMHQGIMRNAAEAATRTAREAPAPAAPEAPKWVPPDWHHPREDF